MLEPLGHLPNARLKVFDRKFYTHQNVCIVQEATGCTAVNQKKNRCTKNCVGLYINTIRARRMSIKLKLSMALWRRGGVSQIVEGRFYGEDTHALCIGL